MGVTESLVIDLLPAWCLTGARISGAPEIPPETQRYHAVFGGIVTSMDNHTPNS